MISFIVEFWSFLRGRKKLWLVPMLILMGILGMALTQFPVIAPFIYSFF